MGGRAETALTLRKEMKEMRKKEGTERKGEGPALLISALLPEGKMRTRERT